LPGEAANRQKRMATKQEQKVAILYEPELDDAQTTGQNK
jgi:hypothetical protein